jgi:hypothetical protein
VLLLLGSRPVRLANPAPWAISSSSSSSTSSTSSKGGSPTTVKEEAQEMLLRMMTHACTFNVNAGVKAILR